MKEKREKYLLKDKEKHICDKYKTNGEVKDARLLCHHYPPIAVEFVAPWEHLPLPFNARHLKLKQKGSFDGEKAPFVTYEKKAVEYNII